MQYLTINNNINGKENNIESYLSFGSEYLF
jgi:hypothetical protein